MSLLKQLVFAFTVSSMVFVAAPLWGQTAFTYQGEVLAEGEKVQGELDFELSLFDAPTLGAQVGATIAFASVEVRDGLFTLELDFGDVFDGTPLWLEIHVRTAGDIGPFDVLTPRKAITSSPFALVSPVASDADTIDGSDASDMALQDVELTGETLQITEGTVTFDVDLLALIEDPDPTDELNTDLTFDNGTLELDVTDAGGTLSADLSSIPDGVDDADNDPTNELITSAALVGNLLELIENGTVTNLVDVTALLNSGALMDGTELQITDGGGTLSVDLAPIQDGVDDPDNDPTNELNTGINLDGSTIEITDAGGTLTADLSTTAIIDDADADPTNELFDSATLTNANDTLRIVEAGITNDVDVAALQNIAIDLSGNTLEVQDGGGTVSADLTGLVDDADPDPANELNTGINLNGGDIEITDAGGTLSADLAVPAIINDADADPTNELFDSADLVDNDTVRIVEAGITNDVDVSTLQNSAIGLAGNTLQVADGGGTVSTDLTGLVNDADPDPANELNTGIALDGSNIEVTDAGGTL
ncbi:MAG: hypothetical protein AAGD38_14300, partial [Acidobacteriota bacterium]